MGTSAAAEPLEEAALLEGGARRAEDSADPRERRFASTLAVTSDGRKV